MCRSFSKIFEKTGEVNLWDDSFQPIWGFLFLRMGITFDFLKEEIKVPVEIDKLKIFVSVTIMLLGNNFIKKDGVPPTLTLYLF